MMARASASGLTYGFVGGAGRSGTTVPGEVFARRRDVAWAKEARFIVDPDGIVDFYVTFSGGGSSPTLYSTRARRLARLLRAVGKPTPVRGVFVRVLRDLGVVTRLPYVVVPAYGEVSIGRMCPGYERFVAKLLGELVDFSFKARWVGSRLFEPASLIYRAPFKDGELERILASFLRSVLEAMAARRGARAVIEDTPWNFLWFDKILGLIPEARLVHIYRDPRDVVTSLLRQQWSPSDPVQAARWYCGLMEQWRTVQARLPRESYVEISLEELVTSPERTLRRLSTFWDLPWDDVVLGADLSRSHTGRWKRELGEADQRAVSRILAAELAAYGYA